jgi:hypothetical protein
VSNTCCVCVAAGSARRLDRRTPAGGCHLGNAVRQAAAARRRDRYGLPARRRSVPIPRRANSPPRGPLFGSAGNRRGELVKGKAHVRRPAAR